MKLTLKQYAVAAAIILAAFVVSGIYVTHRWEARLVSAQADTKAARSETQTALASAAVAEIFAKGAEARGDSLAAVVAALRAESKYARHADSSTRKEFTAAAGIAADTCKAVVAAAQNALAAAARTDSLDRARADTAELASDSYRQSARAALSALAALSGAASHLDTASGVLSKQANGPSLLARLAPKLGVGTAAGLSARGGFDAVVGVTLGWTFGGHR